ncbi:hypothetical protein TWF281_004127 [Arthrobotrys megalospora]
MDVLRALPNLRSIEFSRDISEKSTAFDYWKAVMDAIIKSKKTSIESIKSPGFGYGTIHITPPSKFKFSAKQLKDYQTTFCNLKSLGIATSINREIPDLLKPLWSFIKTFGGSLEKLTVTITHASNYTDTDEIPQGKFIKEIFSLPRLKELRLIDIPMTMADLQNIQKADKIENIYLEDCQIRNPKSNWFAVLQSLRDNRWVFEPYFGSDLISGRNNGKQRP